MLIGVYAGKTALYTLNCHSDKLFANNACCIQKGFEFFSENVYIYCFINHKSGKMFAIVDIKGSQYKVQEKQTLFIPKVEGEKGAKINFDKVLIYSPDEKSVEIGAPTLKHKVEATILDHVKDDKVIVFKKKRRKGYKVTKGHRQNYTQIQIEKIA